MPRIIALARAPCALSTGNTYSSVSLSSRHTNCRLSSSKSGERPTSRLAGTERTPTSRSAMVGYTPKPKNASEFTPVATGAARATSPEASHRRRRQLPGGCDPHRADAIASRDRLAAYGSTADSSVHIRRCWRVSAAPSVPSRAPRLAAGPPTRRRFISACPGVSCVCRSIDRSTKNKESGCVSGAVTNSVRTILVVSIDARPRRY
mmetsp:Transcript_10086/g.31596  ORF Transcript_10086/g.31596 Transcript_10086/m.31596 type:complete len:206 (-) Transcript_10086:669-1286(-)